MTDPTGTSLVLTDAAGNTTTFAYDPLNRLITTINALSGMTVIRYDALGNRLSLTDANTHTTSYTYDRLNRLIQTTDPNSLTMVIGYDGLGNRLSVTNGADETTEFVYDEVNRLSLSRDPLDNETQYRYDGVGNRVAMIDAEEVETRYHFDDLNRLASVIENYQDGTYTPAFPDQDVKTTYTYDAVGNRLSVTDANSHTTTYSYDRLNRQVEVRDPLSHTVRYGYDAVGNRTVLTDAREVVTAFSYDKVNRLTGLDYGDSTPDVSFSYDRVGNRRSMSDGSGTTLYTYDQLYRLATVQNGAGQVITYTYDAVGNRTGLVYPAGQTVTYSYDAGNRLDTVTDWNNGQFGYNYDEANRLTGLSLPNGVESSYTYDQAGRLTFLAHRILTDTLASYAYSLDKVGNRRSVTETLLVPEGVPVGAYLESEGMVVMEAEKAAQVMTGTTHAWQLSTGQSGYTGTAYLQGLPDTDALYHTTAISGSPAARYPIDFTSPGSYTLWLRGYPTNAAGDSVYLGLGGQVITVTGVAPAQWSWGKGQAAQLVVPQSGLYTLTLWLREDGLRVDRLLLTTDTTYLPTGFGPVESVRQTAQMTGALTTLTRTISYGYDDLYRLTSASYTSGEQYQYTYDPAGNRLQ